MGTFDPFLEKQEEIAGSALPANVIMISETNLPGNESGESGFRINGKFMSSVTPAILSRLLDEHAGRLELYALQWSSSPEDIVQEAFIELAKQQEMPEYPVSWLYRVVRNKAISWARSQQTRKKHEAIIQHEYRCWFEENPETRLDAELVSKALQKIPEQEREIIVAYLWGGLTFEQIAEVTGKTSSTAHRIYQSGIQSLKNELGVSWKMKNGK